MLGQAVCNKRAFTLALTACTLLGWQLGFQSLHASEKKQPAALISEPAKAAVAKGSHSTNKSGQTLPAAGLSKPFFAIMAGNHSAPACPRRNEVLSQYVADEQQIDFHSLSPNGSTPKDLKLHVPDYKVALNIKRRHELETFRSPLKLIFYGDSITEGLRGESNGGPHPQKGPIHQVFLRKIVQRYGASAVMAVSGDTTYDLLWRLRHGEGPVWNPGALLLHIGINNIGRMGGYAFIRSDPQHQAHIFSQHSDIIARKVYLGIKQVIAELWKSCTSPIVVTGLFPTGYAWPEGAFGESVVKINQMLSQLAAQAKHSLYYVDCSQAVLHPSTGKIDRTRMPDFLHPNEKGTQKWADCLQPVLDRLLRVAL